MKELTNKACDMSVFSLFS